MPRHFAAKPKLLKRCQDTKSGLETAAAYQLPASEWQLGVRQCMGGQNQPFKVLLKLTVEVCLFLPETATRGRPASLHLPAPVHGAVHSPFHPELSSGCLGVPWKRACGCWCLS